MPPHTQKLTLNVAGFSVFWPLRKILQTGVKKWQNKSWTWQWNPTSAYSQIMKKHKLRVLTTQCQSSLMSVVLEIWEEEYSTLWSDALKEKQYSVHQISCLSQQRSMTPSAVKNTYFSYHFWYLSEHWSSVLCATSWVCNLEWLQSAQWEHSCPKTSHSYSLDNT